MLQGTTVDAKRLKQKLDADPMCQWYVDTFQNIENTFMVSSCIAGGYLASYVLNFEKGDLDIFIDVEHSSTSYLNEKEKTSWIQDFNKEGIDTFNEKTKYTEHHIAESIFFKNGYTVKNNYDMHEWIVCEGEIDKQITQLIFHRGKKHLEFDLKCCELYYNTEKELTGSLNAFCIDKGSNFTGLNFYHYGRVGKYLKRGVPYTQAYKDAEVKSLLATIKHVETQKYKSPYSITNKQRKLHGKDACNYIGWLFQELTDKDKRAYLSLYRDIIPVDVARIKLAEQNFHPKVILDK